MTKKRPPVPEPPPIETFEDGFAVIKATIRGTQYVVREMTAIDYEKAIQQSRDANGKSDDLVLMRLMFAKAIKEPDLTVEEIMVRPASVVGALNRIMQDMHFRWVESDEEKAYREAEEARKAAAAEDEEEGEAKAA